MKVKVNVTNNRDGTWSVWRLREDGVVVSAEVVKIEEFGFLAIKQPARYRVDFEGNTVDSMVDNFQRALGVARRTVRNNG